MPDEHVIDRPQLFDYVVFFETEPEWVDPQGWYYGARFVTTRGEDRIAATVAPDNAEFSLAWWQGERLRLRAVVAHVAEWQLDMPGGEVECLRLTIARDPPRFFTLQLKPCVQVEVVDPWA